MNKINFSSKFSISHIILVLISVLITFGICRIVMNRKINSLNGELIKLEELNDSYLNSLRENQDAAYDQEKEKLLEVKRSKKLEEQLKKCCPGYSIED